MKKNNKYSTKRQRRCDAWMENKLGFSEETLEYHKYGNLFRKI